MKTKTLFSSALFVAALLGVSASAYAGAAAAPAPLRILFVAGGCCHDYINQPAIIKKALEERANVTVDIFTSANGTNTTHEIYKTADWAKNYDLVIHDECSADITDLAYIGNILKPHADGLPAVMLHCAMHNYRTTGWNTGALTPWFELTGLQSSGHGAQLPIALNFFNKQSEITKGMANWTTIGEELYNNYAGGVLPTATPLVYGKQGADETVVVWTNIYKQKARVFSTTLGHNNATVEDPRYLDLVTRGVLWAANKLNANYLKPVPTAVPQKQAKMADLISTEETALLQTQECGCHDADSDATVTDYDLTLAFAN